MITIPHLLACHKRAIGIKAVILDADGTTVITKTPAIRTDVDTYTFTFPGPACPICFDHF